MKNYLLPVLALTLLVGCSDQFAGSNVAGSTDDVAGKRRKTPGAIKPPTIASKFDSAVAWPLCGRINENPPIGWDAAQGCPQNRFGNPGFTDFPFSSTFGPRQKASESYRYDYHRGIDIPTPIGTPLFAMTGGKVEKAGNDASYTDPVIQIRHYRPGEKSCTNGGCYYSNYLHVSAWVVAKDDIVVKGQLIGYSGASGDSGFPHLHFEVRNSPGSYDKYANWNRDTIHPLRVLPYYDSGAANMNVAVTGVDTSVPGQPDVTVRVTMPNDVELDLNRVEVAVFTSKANGTQVLVAQAGDSPSGMTPEGTGYAVNPPSFDMMQWNRQYSYKDNSALPYSVFRTGGAFESPYAGIMPASYDAAFHLDHALAGFPRIGEFNGARIAPAQFNAQSASYVLDVTFTELQGPVNPMKLCVKARAIDARGNATGWVESNCNVY